MSSNRLGKLQFVWWEAKPADEVGMWWGQLAGGTNRLMLVAEHLSTLPGRRKTEDALNELGYDLENYFTRTYELRERAFGLMERAMGYKRRGLGKAKLPKFRAATAAAVPITFHGMSAPFFSLLDFLDDDIDIRNDHTHLRFLNISLTTNDNVFDPSNVLMETQGGEFAKPMNAHLRHEIARLSTEYSKRVWDIFKMTWKVLEATQPLL
jgi:hypothetical protein